MNERGARVNRRTLLKLGLTAASGVAAPALAAQEAKPAAEEPTPSPAYMGVLVDTTLCIGCRKCEEACNRRNNLPPHRRDLLGPGRPPHVPAAHRERLHRREPVPRQPVAGPGRRAADLLQGPVHALPRPVLRVGVHRRRADQVARRRGGLQPDHLHRLPVLPGRLPLRGPGLRVRRRAHAAGAQVRVLRRPRQGDRRQSRVRRVVPDRGAGVRPAGGAGRHGKGPHQAAAGPLRQPHLRRERGGRHLLAVPDRPAGPGDRPAGAHRDRAATADRGHPARDLQVRHHPGRVLRRCWPASCGATTASRREHASRQGDARDDSSGGARGRCQ